MASNMSFLRVTCRTRKRLKGKGKIKNVRLSCLPVQSSEGTFYISWHPHPVLSLFVQLKDRITDYIFLSRKQISHNFQALKHELFLHRHSICRRTVDKLKGRLTKKSSHLRSLYSRQRGHNLHTSWYLLPTIP